MNSVILQKRKELAFNYNRIFNEKLISTIQQTNKSNLKKSGLRSH